MNNNVDTLIEFLSFDLWNSDKIFNKFKEVRNNIYREGEQYGERFLYIEGSRKNKVVLVAHTDTVFTDTTDKHELLINNNIISNKYNDLGCGIGADDRAGCAILWLLRNSGHSILIVDGEEMGCIGSSWLMDNNKDIANKINSHMFMIGFDRRGSNDYKCYDVGNKKFRKYIENNYIGYKEPDRYSYSDIAVLCDKICGVNLSVGYYNEHTANEYIKINEWENTLKITERFLMNENKIIKHKL